jgi:hypothetical protein
MISVLEPETFRGQRPWPHSARTLPIVILDEFLVADELDGLLRYALASRQSFIHSEVTRADGGSGEDLGHRRSRVLFDTGPFQPVFQRRIMGALPGVLRSLGLAPFPVNSLEIQLTASNDQEFFQPHIDSDKGELSARELTFVYFFHREPRRFGGGELRIFETRVSDDPPTPSERFELVYPLQNNIVFFPSYFLHEILPVICPSRDFADSRFTVNGWCRR